MNFTSNSWTLESLAELTTTPSYTEGTKPINVRNINWTADFSEKDLVGDIPKGSSQVDLVDSTGTTMTENISLRIRSKAITDVYSASSLSCDKLVHKQGRQVNIKIEERFRASNSVSGETGDVPLSASLTFTVPTHISITPDAVEYFVKNAIGALFNTDTVDGTRISEIIRGHLSPTD